MERTLSLTPYLQREVSISLQLRAVKNVASLKHLGDATFLIFVLITGMTIIAFISEHYGAIFSPLKA